MALKFNEMEKKEVAKLLANRINQEHYILHYMDKVFKAGQDQAKPHRIKIAHLRKLEWLLRDEEITYSRMVEILNEIAAGKHKNGIEI